MNFTTLDRILAIGPDQSGFQLLCAHLEQTIEAEQQNVCDYLSEQLKPWPDETRTAPWNWLAALWLEKSLSLKWTLARRIDAEHPILFTWSPSCIPEDTLAFKFITSMAFGPGQKLTQFVFDHASLFPALRCLHTRGAGDEEDIAAKPLSRSKLIKQIESVQFGDQHDSCYTLGEPDYFCLLFSGVTEYKAKKLKKLSIRSYNLDNFINFLNDHSFPKLETLSVSFEHWASWNKEHDCTPPSPHTIKLLNRLHQLSALNVLSNFVDKFFSFYGIRPRNISLNIVNYKADEISNNTALSNLKELSITGQHPINNLLNGKQTILRLSNITESLAQQNLSSITRLEITGGYSSTKPIIETIHNTSLKQLRHLSIISGVGGGEKYDGNQVINAINHSGILNTLESLEVSDGWNSNNVDLSIIENFILCATPELKNLTISSSYIGDIGTALFQKGTFPKLERLEISVDKLSNKGFENLFKAHFPKLKHLDLSYCEISAMNIDNNTIENLPFLRSLNLKANQFGTIMEDNPWNQKLMSQLWTLDVSKNPLNDKSLQQLFSLPQTNLVNLNLSKDDYSEDDGNPANEEERSGLYLTKTAQQLANSSTVKFLDALIMEKYADDSDHGYMNNWKALFPFCDKGRELIIQSPTLRPTCISSISDNIDIQTDHPALKMVSNKARQQLNNIDKSRRSLTLNRDTRRLLTQTEFFIADDHGNIIALELVGAKLNNIDWIEEFPHLESLSLSTNNFSQLPAAITHLAHLRRLDLSNNKITHLPPDINRLNRLTQLNLASNIFKVLPVELEQLSNLQSLNLSNNPLSNTLEKREKLKTQWGQTLTGY